MNIFHFCILDQFSFINQNQKHFIDCRGENWVHIVPEYSNEVPQTFSDVMALAGILSKAMPKLTMNTEQNVFSNNTW